MIYLLSIEELRERYTYWWSDYIPQVIISLNKEVTIISGETLTKKVETGTVLDAASTNYWKAEQLKKICKLFYEGKIKPFDYFLVTDIWFPGIEMIKYMSQLYSIPVSIWGVWHAGSTTIGDFVEPMHEWSKHFEIGFLNLCDGVFVGSEYSKISIITRLLYNLPENEIDKIANKINACGMPLDFNSIRKYTTNEKENIILFPHRPDIEKNPHIFIDIIYAISTYWDKFEDYKFVFCTSKEKYKSSSVWINALLSSLKLRFKNIEVLENLEKEDYYKLLAKSRVVISTTQEENFGYCAVEALAVGTQVLLPNDFSYPEIVEENQLLLYDNYDNLMNKIINIENNIIVAKELQAYVEPYGSVVGQWIKIMRA